MDRKAPTEPESAEPVDLLGLPPEPGRQRRRGAALFWGLLVLLAAAGLVLQYAWFERDRLAHDARFRPHLEQMCELAGCELPLRRAAQRIELVHHLVRGHPSRDGALLISATLVNRAPFPQPYPVVGITMTDLAQQVVAWRRFTPEQYLLGPHPPVFGPGEQADLLLEVSDPGRSAVSFEFSMHL